MASGVPLNALDASFMTCPDLLGVLGHVNRPQEDLSVTCGSKLPVILPCDVDNLATLVKLVKWVLLNGIWVPDQDVGFVAS